MSDSVVTPYHVVVFNGEVPIVTERCADLDGSAQIGQRLWRAFMTREHLYGPRFHRFTCRVTPGPSHEEIHPH